MIARSEWSTLPRRGSLMTGPAAGITLHHAPERHLDASATPTQEQTHLRIIERAHIRDNGWLDIGYNWIVCQSGRVYEGRGWGIVGAHAGSKQGNETTIGILLMLNGDRTAGHPALWGALLKLGQDGIAGGHIRKEPDVFGHRHWRGTQCPGELVQAQRVPELRAALRAPADKPQIGESRFSGIHGRIILTRYESDDNWSFIPAARLSEIPSIRAGARWSQMPTEPRG